MTKYISIITLALIALVSWNCATTVDTASMGDKARYNYADSIFKSESYDIALKEYEAFLLQFPGSEFVDDAQFAVGECHFARKEFLLAAYDFSKLIKNMASSPLIPNAQYKLAECYFELSPQFPLDQKYTRKGIEELQAFIDFFPTDPRVTGAEKQIKELYVKLAEKEFHNAQIYERMEYYSAAIQYYGKVVETYHDTKFAPIASYNKIKLLVLKKRNVEALNEISGFLSKYSTNERINDVKEIKSQLTPKESEKKAG